MAYVTTDTTSTAGPKGSLFAKLRAALASTLTVIQVARMQSILSGLSDRQLHDIGITRADIPAYADRLITGTTETD